MEQETVEQLTEAGYEAYNVTTENYLTLESSLKCDFTELGLDPNGSYIIVISGEDKEADNSNSNSRASGRSIVDPNPSLIGNIGEGFTYNYQGTPYTMRYVTVTSNENAEYGDSDYAELSKSYISNFGFDFLTTVFSILLDYATSPVPTSAIFSLLNLESADGYTMGQESTMILFGGAVWTRVFIQVYNSDRGWCTAQSSAYATSTAYCSGLVLNTSTGIYQPKTGEAQYHPHYSPKYFSEEQRKQDAVLAYLRYDIDYDCTGDIQFSHYGNILLTFYEPFGMQSYLPPSD